MMIFSCNKKNTIEKLSEPKYITIQPFGDLKPNEVSKIETEIKKVYPYINVLKPIAFQKNAYYAPRNRYRADSIIKYLNSRTENNTIIGLTSKDISVTKGNIADYGVMGLGYRPGNACVASNYRLSKSGESQFYKIALHELGHTQGLKHCPEKSCFMRDAEGGNPTNEETDFCKSCKKFLQSKNWNI